MNLATLQNMVYSWLDDPNRSYFTLTEVNQWLNNGQREAQKQLLQAGENYYVVKYSGATIANADVYALPADCKEINKLEVVISGTGVNEQRRTLFFRTLVQIDQITTTGSPEIYTLRKNSIVLRPIPDQAYTLYLHESYRVIDMALTSDIPDVPEDYHEYVAVLATLDGFLKDQRDPSAFVTAKRDFYVDRMRQDAQKRQVGQPRMVHSSDDYETGSVF